MTWEPIDLAAADRALKAEILRVAADERIYLGADPYDPDGKAYRYDEDRADLFDGSNVTAEVKELVWEGLLAYQGGAIRITDAGRAALGETS